MRSGSQITISEILGSEDGLQLVRDCAMYREQAARIREEIASMARSQPYEVYAALYDDLATVQASYHAACKEFGLFVFLGLAVRKFEGIGNG